MSTSTKLIPGDIFYTQSGNQYRIYKLLVEDEDSGGYHVLCYESVDALPDEEDILNLNVSIYHIPMHQDSFKEPKFLAHANITWKDLTGYHEYLRQTQGPEYVIQTAFDYFNEAYVLTDEKKYDEVIDLYSRSIDLVPTFFKAIMNRAYCKMYLGHSKEAIEDLQKTKEQFEEAVAIDPNDEASQDILRKINEQLAIFVNTETNN